MARTGLPASCGQAGPCSAAVSRQLRPQFPFPEALVRPHWVAWHCLASLEAVTETELWAAAVDPGAPAQALGAGAGAVSRSQWEGGQRERSHGVPQGMKPTRRGRAKGCRPG